MGAFDDLIPESKGGGAFDDLIPGKGTPSKEDVQKAMALRQIMSGFPILGAGGMGPDIAFGGAEPLMKVAQMVAHLGGNDTAPAQAVDAGVNAAKGAYEKAAQPDAFPGTGVARGIGQGVATAPVAVAKGGALAAGAANGAISGVLEPVYGDTSNFWTDTAKTGAKGAAVGAGIGGAAKVVGKVVGGAKLDDAQQALQDEGVSTTLGQKLGGFAKAIEDKATSIPILGDLIQNQRFKGITDFNKAVYSRALAPFGDEGAQVVAKADVGNKGIAAVGDFLSGKYEAALAQSAPSPLDGQTRDALVQLSSMVPSNLRADFVSAIQRNVVDKLTPAGTLTPSVAKAADSELGRMARNYAGSSDAAQRELSLALREAQSELREMFARANPDSAPLIRAADQGWATLVQMERAGSMLGAKDGVFTPSQLLNAIKRGDTSIRDRTFARGDMLNQDLAQAADKVLPSKVPDSGTVGRALVADLATGGGLAHFVDPTLGMATVAASLPYVPVIGPALTNLATVARPAIARQGGDLMAKLAPYLGLLAGSRP